MDKLPLERKRYEIVHKYISHTFVMYPGILCKLVIDVRVTTLKKKEAVPYKGLKSKLTKT